MNLVAGVMSFPVPAGFDMSLVRSEDVAHRMEDQGWGDLAAVLRRNLAISQSLHTVDALLLMLHVREVLNFELWEQVRVVEEVPVQDQVVKGDLDCFGDCIAK